MSTCGSWQYGTSAKIERRIKRSGHRVPETSRVPAEIDPIPGRECAHAVPTTADEFMPHHWLSENSGEEWQSHMSMWLISRWISCGALLRVGGGSLVVYRGRQPLGEPMAASRTINARDDELQTAVCVPTSGLTLRQESGWSDLLKIGSPRRRSGRHIEARDRHACECRSGLAHVVARAVLGAPSAVANIWRHWKPASPGAV
jgi:hypothetical protein